MTIEAIKSRLDANGGIECLVGFLFNNGGAWYIWGDKTKFNPETDLIADKESEIMLCRGFYPTNTNMIKTFTIPRVIEKEVFTIEGMMFVKNADDMIRVEKSDTIMY